VPVLGASWDLEEVVARHGVEHVIVTFSTAPNDVLLRLVRRCEELRVSVSFVPRLFEKVNGRVSVEHIGGLPLVSAYPANPHGWQFAVKYAFDRVAAAFVLLLVLPVMVARAWIAGWAQVNGLRGKTSLADRVEWDNYYIENWSLWLDVKIALLTALAVVKSSPQVE
jgi:lipopolysaccharide/colanic/teichoic acid biosynthesis glycosyltransferase